MTQRPIHIWKDLSTGQWFCDGPNDEERASFPSQAEAMFEAQARAEKLYYQDIWQWSDDEFRQFLEGLS